MAWTDDGVTNFLRSLVNEYNTTKYWSAVEVELYKQAGMSRVLSEFLPQLYPIYGTYEDFGITAADADYDVPDNCYRIAQILVKETGNKLRHIPRPELYKYSDYDPGDPVGWTYKAGAVHLIPTPSATDTDYLEWHYMPILDAVTEFPDCLAPLIAIEGAVWACFKDQKLAPSLLAMKREYKMAALTDLTLAAIEHVEVFPDYMEEDSFA